MFQLSPHGAGGRLDRGLQADAEGKLLHKLKQTKVSFCNILQYAGAGNHPDRAAQTVRGRREASLLPRGFIGEEKYSQSCSMSGQLCGLGRSHLQYLLPAGSNRENRATNMNQVRLILSLSKI